MKNVLSFIGLFSTTVIGVLVSLTLLNRFEGSALTQVTAIAAFLILYAFALFICYGLARKLMNRPTS